MAIVGTELCKVLGSHYLHIRHSLEALFHGIVVMLGFVNFLHCGLGSSQKSTFVLMNRNPPILNAL